VDGEVDHSCRRRDSNPREAGPRGILRRRGRAGRSRTFWIRCPFSIRALRPEGLYSEGYGHPDGHL
jgi:hypothetical protein